MTAHRAARAVLPFLFVAGLSAVGGCKTKVDPNAFEAGAAATPSAVDSSAAAATDEAGAPAASGSGEALAPLQTSTAKAAATAPKTGSNATTKPATDPPECVQARATCGARVMTLTSRKDCEAQRSACFNKGGHL